MPRVRDYWSPILSSITKEPDLHAACYVSSGLEALLGWQGEYTRHRRRRKRHSVAEGTFVATTTIMLRLVESEKQALLSLCAPQHAHAWKTS